MLKKMLLSRFLKRKKYTLQEFQIGGYNEETFLGELFSYFSIETALIGHIVNINPFDQPAVEQIKKITKQQLA